MSNFYSILTGNVFPRPAHISAGPIRDPHKMSPEDAEQFKKLGVVQKDLEDMFQQATLINFERHNFYKEIDRCLAPETEIVLLDGRVVSIKEMADREKEFVGCSVLSVNPRTLALEPDRIVGCRKTGVDQELVRVWLDNGKYVDCTPDHRFMMRGGDFKEAKDLENQDSLMPFYSDVDHQGYLKVYRPDEGSFWYLHRIIAESVNGKLNKGEVVHHLNFNKKDNSVSNLEVMREKRHSGLHAKINSELWRGKTNETSDLVRKRSESHRGISGWQKGLTSETDSRVAKRALSFKLGNHSAWNKGLTKESDERLANKARAQLGVSLSDSHKKSLSESHKGYRFSDERKKKHSEALKKTFRQCKRIVSDLGRQRMSETARLRWENTSYREKMEKHLEFARSFRNHKVVRVERLNALSDVYDITTERNHNFPLGVGIFVHNSLTHPLMRSAVGLFADVASTYSQIQGATVWVTSDENQLYESELNFMLDSIDIEEKIYDWTWNVAAYGDLFVRVVAVPGVGIVAVEDDDHPINLSRVDYNGRLVGFYESPQGAPGVYNKSLMPPWEFVHFRLLGAKKKRPSYNDPTYAEYRSIELMAPETRRVTTKYGTSILTDAVPVYKRLRMAEDCILLARLSRGIRKYIYKVAVNGNNNEAIANILDQYGSLLKRVRAMDVSDDSPNFEDRYQSMNALEDVIVPVWGEVGNLEKEELGGDVDIHWITDVTELRNLLASALKVPLQLLGGYTSDLPSSLGTSALERIDIRFARSARRVQRTMIEGIYRLCQIHLAFKGMSPDVRLFSVNMPETSSAEEEELKDALDKGVDIVDKLADLVIKVFGDEQINKISLFNLLNTKILKFNDLDVKSIMKDVNESELKKAVAVKQQVIQELYRKHGDLHAMLPTDTSVKRLLEGKGVPGISALNESWHRLYKNAQVRETVPVRQIRGRKK